MRLAGVKIFICLFFICVSAVSQTPDEIMKRKNPPNQLVNDYGNVLDPAEESRLERKLRDYNDSTSVQIAIVTFQKLDGYPIEMLANEIGEKWGVGQKEKHNGIVIVLSKDDRKVTLRGAYGIQAKMPPTVEKIIIDKEMIPAFKQGNYYQGLDNATTAISKVLAGKYDAEPKKENDSYGFLIFLFFIGVIILFIIIASKGGGGRGGNRGRRGFDWTDVILTSGGASNWGRGWGSGSSGGGFGGGGFGGFGGGSFGGGGASGSW